MPPATRGSALLFAYGGFAQLCAAMWEFRNRNVVGATGFGTFGAFWIGLGFWVLLVVNPAVAAIRPATAVATVTRAQPRPRLDPARVRHLHHVRDDPDPSDEHGLVHHVLPPVGHPHRPVHRELQRWRSAPSHDHDQDRRLHRRGHRGSPPGTPRRLACRPASAASSGSPWARRSSSKHPDRVSAGDRAGAARSPAFASAGSSPPAALEPDSVNQTP